MEAESEPQAEPELVEMPQAEPLAESESEEMPQAELMASESFAGLLEPRQVWPITPSQKQAAVDAMLKIIQHPKTSNREKTAAVRALLSAEAQNIAAAARRDTDCDTDYELGRNRVASILRAIRGEKDE
jgi:hypothetical protein